MDTMLDQSTTPGDLTDEADEDEDEDGGMAETRAEADRRRGRLKEAALAK